MNEFNQPAPVIRYEWVSNLIKPLSFPSYHANEEFAMFVTPTKWFLLSGNGMVMQDDPKDWTGTLRWPFNRDDVRKWAERENLKIWDFELNEDPWYTDTITTEMLTIVLKKLGVVI